MRRKGIPKIRYPENRRRETKSKSSIGAVLFLVGLVLYLMSAWRLTSWCFFSGFLLAALATFACGASAIMMWSIPRILVTMFSLAAVLLLAAFLFMGFC